MVALAGGAVCGPPFGMDEDASHAVFVKPVAAARRPFEGVGREGVIADGASGNGVGGCRHGWAVRDPADDRGLEDLIRSAFPKQLLLLSRVEVFAFLNGGVPLAKPPGQQGY